MILIAYIIAVCLLYKKDYRGAALSDAIIGVLTVVTIISLASA